MTEADIAALFITLKLACVTTLVLVLVGVPIAWWLAHTKLRYKVIIEAIIALPLVLPPTVIGFYLLLMLGPKGPGGFFAGLWGQHTLAFSFTGLVIGSIVYSLPFVVQPLQNAFYAFGKRELEAAATLRAGPLDRFFSVVVPNTKNSLITAATLGFAHTVGEFGVVLMIGGNIQGKTQVLSIAIYEHVEALEFANAHILAGGLLLGSFVLLSIIYKMNYRMRMISV